jgi:hypothetical protein
VTLFKIININIDYIAIQFFIKMDKLFFLILSLNSGNMNQENMVLLLENWHCIEFIYLLYFDRVVSNKHPHYGNSSLL